jgi:hypothetical protein
LVAIGIFCGLLLILVRIFARLAALNPNVSAALITALAAGATVLYTQAANRRKDIAEAHRPAKAAVYRRFMDLASEILTAQNSRDGNPGFRGDLKKDFVEMTSELIIWGSPDVLRKFAAWRLAANVGGPAVLLATDDFMQAMRQDLGNSNRGLRRGDVLKLYLRDPREIEKAFN